MLACQTSLYTPDVEIPGGDTSLGGCPWTLMVRCRHHRLTTGVLLLLWTRRVWCRRRRSSMVIFHVVILSRYPDTVEKGITVPPCYSNISCSEISSGVQQLRPDTRMWSGPPHGHTLWFLPGPPASDSPIVTSPQKPPLDYGTADVGRRRQP